MNPLQPLLPFDILNQIVAYVPVVSSPGYKIPTPTLAALSITCRALTAPAQRRLFEKIALITPLGWSTAHKPDTRTIALRDLFRTSPHLASYGLTVLFIMDEPDDEYMDMSTEILQCILQNASAHDIFIATPDVEIPMDWTTLKPGLQEVLVGLCHSAHVRAIRLRGITRIPMAILEAPALQKVNLESVYSFLPPQTSADADASGLEGSAEGESTKSEVKVGTIVFHDDDGNGMRTLREVLKVASQLREFEIHTLLGDALSPRLVASDTPSSDSSGPHQCLPSFTNLHTLTVAMSNMPPTRMCRVPMITQGLCELLRTLPIPAARSSSEPSASGHSDLSELGSQPKPKLAHLNLVISIPHWATESDTDTYGFSHLDDLLCESGWYPNLRRVCLVLFVTYARVTGKRNLKAEKAILVEKVRRDWIPKLTARKDLEVVLSADCT